MSRGTVGAGDRLASGRQRNAAFPAGGAKVGDKVQINQGMVASEADRKAADKEKERLTALAGSEVAPRMKRVARPLYDRVLVRKATVEEVTKGGIFIPEEAKDRPLEGIVVRVGKGKRDINGILWALDVKEDDTVLFGKYAGTEIKIDGETVLMLREDEILCTIE